jgi:hypothetical protein
MLEIMRAIKNILTGIVIVYLFGNCNKESASSADSSVGAGGSTARFTINGNYLYVVDHTSLKAFQISNPQSPVYKSKTEIGINIETIFPYGDKLFIGSSSTMYIFSLADPDRPKQIAEAQYTIRMSCDPVVARDSVAYATLRGTSACGGMMSALVVYNIKNIESPVHVNTVSLTAPFGLGVKNNALYVCEGAQGLKVFDVTNAYSPTLSRTVGAEIFYDVIPYNNILIAQVAGGFVLYDIGTNPLNPVFISKVLY